MVVAWTSTSMCCLTFAILIDIVLARGHRASPTMRRVTNAIDTMLFLICHADNITDRLR